MYENLITAIRKAACQFKQCGMCPKGKGLCIDRYALQAADVIENLICEVADEHNARLDAEERQRWIPVTERLPENGEYLVATHFLGMENEPLLVSIADCAQSLESVDEYDFEGDNRPGWYCYDSEYGFYERTGIRFYMPLPEPPKEGDA